MTKSRLYAELQANELQALFNARSTRFNKRTNCIEYIYRYVTGKYVVKCVGINANGVPFSGTCLTDGKNEGYFFFQHSDERIVKNVMQNPGLVYDPEFLAQRDVILAL